MAFYKIISFFMLLDSSLLGSTMEFRRIVSDGTLTEQPKKEQEKTLIFL